MIIDNIDTSDIPEITDFSNARPNPYAERIRKHGYSVTIRYSPEDVARMKQDAAEKIKSLDMLELDNNELAALEKYRNANNSRTERLQQDSAIFVEADVVKRFEALAEKQGIPRDKLITATLKDYLEQGKLAEIGVDVEPVTSRSKLRAQLQGSHTKHLSGILQAQEDINLEELQAERRAKL